MAQARRTSGLAGRRPEPTNPWARLHRPALLLAATCVYGVTAFMLIEKWSFIDSLYMVLQTLTTVGLGPSRELDASGELITVTLMLAGVALVVIILSLAAQAIAEGGIGELRRRRKLQQKIDKLRDHFIVCAYGRVGRTVSRELEAEGVPFVVLDPLEELEERMMQDGVYYIIGDPAEEGVLADAGIGRAKGLICAVDSDAINVYITLTARSLSPEIFIVARASEALAAERLYKAGADRVLSPYVTSGRHMAMQALHPRVLDYFEVGKDSSAIRLEEVTIEPGSEFIGQTLTQAAGAANVLAIARADGSVIPNPEPSVTLEADDLVLLMGRAEELRQLEGR